MTEADLLAAAEDTEVAENQGDRWTFAAVLPESGFVHTTHTGHRTQEEAEVFVGKIKAKSDGKAPFFISDCWFYTAVLYAIYGVWTTPAYGGRGRRPKPKRVIAPALRYAQVHKKETAKVK